MTGGEFKAVRGRLGRTQQEMATLLAVSLGAIHSYEQGWRTVPAHAERQVFYLLWKQLHRERRPEACWAQLDCPDDRRQACPAHELGAGDVCWFLNGTMCRGEVTSGWTAKLAECRTCPVFEPLRQFLGPA